MNAVKGWSDQNIRTGIEDGRFSKKFFPEADNSDKQNLYQNYEKQERKVSELKSKLEELSKVKIETEEYKKLKDDMKALEDEFEKIEAKQREWLDMGFR